MLDARRIEHIDMLKGIAIILIVFFHLLPQYFPCGFVGVDVFFVISGYFLIGRQLDGGKDFVLIPFLQKKALRLLTPYFVLIILVAIASILLLAAKDMIDGARLLRACQFATGNIFLSHLQGNYFSIDTRTLPLMHLWYMGVLLQSYLLFSLLFYAWQRCQCGKRTRIIHISLIGVLSFSIAHLHCLPLPWEFASDTYYWTTGRLWEFSLGGLLYVLPKQAHVRTSIITSSCAVLLLFICSLLPIKECAWTILLGSACCCSILKCEIASQSFSPLWSAPLIWLGKISFSLYLVHWPCICFAEYLIGHQLSFLSAGVTLILIMTASIIFYKKIECCRPPLWVLPILLLGGVSLHLAICRTNGFRAYLHQEANFTVSEYDDMMDYIPPLDRNSPLYNGTEGIMPNNFSPHPNPDAILLRDIGDKVQKPSFVILGDSHALDFADGMHASGMKNGWRGVYLDSYVVPFWNAEYPMDFQNIGVHFYKEKAMKIMEWLKIHPELHTVFIVQYWSNRFYSHHTWDGELVTGDMVQVRAAELCEFCKKLIDIGKQVVLLTDNPTIPAKSPARVLRSYRMYPLWKKYPTDFECNIETYEKHNAAFNHELDNMEKAGLCIVLHREDSFFEKGIYRAYDGQYLKHRDKDHLTLDGALFSFSGIIDQLKNILTPKSE